MDVVDGAFRRSYIPYLRGGLGPDAGLYVRRSACRGCVGCVDGMKPYHLGIYYTENRVKTAQSVGISGFASIITQTQGEEAARQFILFIQKREAMIQEVTILHRQLKQQDQAVSLSRQRKSYEDFLKSLLLMGLEVATKQVGDELKKKGYEGWGQYLGEVSEGLKDFRATTFRKPQPQPTVSNSASEVSELVSSADAFFFTLRYVDWSQGRLPSPPDPKEFGLDPGICKKIEKLTLGEIRLLLKKAEEYERQLTARSGADGDARIPLA